MHCSNSGASKCLDRLQVLVYFCHHLADPKRKKLSRLCTVQGRGAQLDEDRASIRTPRILFAQESDASDPQHLAGYVLDRPPATILWREADLCSTALDAFQNNRQHGSRCVCSTALDAFQSKSY